MQNKRLKNKFKQQLVMTLCLLFGVVQWASASPEQERIYLLQLIHQMDAMKPTLLAAEKEQSKTARIQFHYTAYQDMTGQLHPGVWDDLQKIRSGIEEKLQRLPGEVKTLEPIQGDYMESVNQEQIP